MGNREIKIAVETCTDENGAVTKTFYTHGPGVDEHLAFERDGQYYYYHADGLGSIAAITDQAAIVVQRYEYDSYGMPTPSTGFRNSYAYTGREWDKEAGLYYYRARYYDPMEGRFISKDPISFAGGDVNLYGYTGNNPINKTDPSGLSSVPALIVVGIAGGWYLYNNNETFRGVVDAMLNIVVPDTGIGTAGSVLLNPDLPDAALKIKVNIFNKEQAIMGNFSTLSISQFGKDIQGGSNAYLNAVNNRSCNVLQ